MTRFFLSSALLGLLLSVGIISASAETSEITSTSTLLTDTNGDGVVSIAAFGDSLTYGIGDGIPPGSFYESLPEGTGPGGYPRRLNAIFGVPVSSGGAPGEEFLTAGVFRFPSYVISRKSDILIFLEGTNDAVKLVNRGEYTRALQRVVNVARAEGRTVVLLTLPPPVGVHEALAPFTSSYSEAVRQVASLNDIAMADVERAWTTSCPIISQCRFYSLPEGLHPNRLGYDAMAQTIAAVLVGVDLFTPTGAADLETALGIPAGSVVVKSPNSASPSTNR